MKPTPLIKETQIAAGAALFYCNDDISAVMELLEEDVITGLRDIEKRHKKLCNVLREALAWSKQDATNEDCFPSQDMLDARVDALQEALKLARQ
jgi:hypothetical protein